MKQESSVIKQILDEELGLRAQNAFTWVDPNPFTSGAFLLTHRAHLANSQLVLIVAGNSSGDSRDLTNDARNADRLRAVHLSSARVHVPVVYWNLTTPRLMVREYQEGMPLDKSYLLDEGYDTGLAAEALFLLFAEAMISDGFFHVYKENSLSVLPGSKIFINDFSTIGFLPSEIRLLLSRVIQAYMDEDLDAFSRSLRALADKSFYAQAHEFDKFLSQMRSENGQDSFGRVLFEITRQSRDYGFNFSKNISLFFDSLSELQDKISALEPNFNFKNNFYNVVKHVRRLPVSISKLQRLSC